VADDVRKPDGPPSLPRAAYRCSDGTAGPWKSWKQDVGRGLPSLWVHALCASVALSPVDLFSAPKISSGFGRYGVAVEI
jgi:hypothetical protein